MTYFSMLNCQLHNNTFRENNIEIETTPSKWFRNCALILWCSSKVDVRHLGMSLVFLRRVVIARNE